MDIEAQPQIHSPQRSFFAYSISYFFSFIRQGYELFHKYKKRALVVFILLLEVSSLSLDVSKGSQFILRLVVLPLATLSFGITICLCIVEGNLAAFRPQAEIQLALLDVSLSVVQLIAAILEVSGVEINNYSLSAFSIFNAILNTVFIFQKDKRDSDTSFLENNIPLLDNLAILNLSTLTNPVSVGDLVRLERDGYIYDSLPDSPLTKRPVEDQQPFVESELSRFHASDSSTQVTPWRKYKRFNRRQIKGLQLTAEWLDDLRWPILSPLKSLKRWLDEVLLSYPFNDLCGIIGKHFSYEIQKAKLQIPIDFNQDSTYWKLLLENFLEKYKLDVDFGGSGGKLRLGHADDAENKFLPGGDQWDKYCMSVNQIALQRRRKGVNSKLEQERKISGKIPDEDKKFR